MSEYEDDGLDCCRGIANAIPLSLSLWAVILGVSYGAWRIWHTGRLADATVIFGFVGLILVSLSAWFRHQLSGAREDEQGSAACEPRKAYDGSRHVPKGRGKVRSSAAIISARRVSETVPDLEGAKTGS